MSEFSRPNFVGIGVPKAGTTWLHNVIGSHPNAFTPSMRKEVHYFDRHYEKGEEWYLRFFKDAGKDNVVRGEITPHYLYDPQCAQRIKAFGIENVLLVLRDPVDRTWSNYVFRKRQDGFEGTLTQFLEEYPHMVSWSNYSEHIRQWQDLFGEKLHILIYEEIKNNSDLLRRQLSDALSIDAALFDPKVENARVNTAFIPKHRGLYIAMVRLNKWLVDRNLDVVANSLKNMPGAVRFLRKPRKDARLLPTIEEREVLREIFTPSIQELEGLIKRDLSIWNTET